MMSVLADRFQEVGFDIAFKQILARTPSSVDPDEIVAKVTRALQVQDKRAGQDSLQALLSEMKPTRRRIWLHFNSRALLLYSRRSHSGK